MMMRKLYMVLVGMLLASAPVLAQGEKQSSVSATVTPTALPGEEKLSAQERAERDFLMPVRRKQAAALRATAREEGTTQPALEAVARTLEEATAPKPAAEATKPSAPSATYHRRTSSSHRSTAHRTSSSKHKTTATKKKTTATRRRR